MNLSNLTGVRSDGYALVETYDLDPWKWNVDISTLFGLAIFIHWPFLG